jgi:5-methylcytosine-specific restriction enzyme subunit McrC
MDEGSAGYVGAIPVRNLWLLMLYASGEYRELGSGLQDVEENPDDIPDLVAAMLVKAVERRLKRNLSFGYRRREVVAGRVRGRIDLLETESRLLLERGRVSCSYEELCVDTPRNRAVRSALLRLSRIVRDRELGAACASLAARLWEAGVTGEAPERRALDQERFGRHDLEDRQMVCLARLAFDLALPMEKAGTRSLPCPEREEHWVRRLFEKAVGGFYAYALDPSAWSVRAGARIYWPASGKSSVLETIMPEMKTDIVLENLRSRAQTVIDTKFAEIVHPGWHRDQTLHSGYLYQIYAYLRTQEKTEDPSSLDSTGVLLHPAVGVPYDESVMVQGHRLRFMTVELAGEGRSIRESLLSITKSNGGDGR